MYVTIYLSLCIYLPIYLSLSISIILLYMYLLICLSLSLLFLQEMAKIETVKFQSMVEVLGRETIQAMAAGPQHQQV